MVDLKSTIKKFILSSVLVFSVMNPFAVYAEVIKTEAVQEPTILTYEKAVELAIKESNDLKNLKLDKESKTIKIDDALDQFGTSLYDPQVLALMKLQKSDKINTDKTAKMENYIKQALAFKIKSSLPLPTSLLEMIS